MVSSFFWFFLINYQKKSAIKNAIDYGLFFGEYVRKSTRYGMLTFHRELIQKTVEEISSVQGVKRIRIFDKKGKIRYSSVKEEIGSVMNKDSADCTKCHMTGRPRETLLRKERWIITDDMTGTRVLKVIEPVYNEPACYTAPCHVHAEDQKVLGIVKCNISLSALYETVKNEERAIAVYVLSFVTAISLALCLIVWKFVSRPVALLVEGMENAGRGNLDHTVRIESRDEMGALAAAFNAMVADLKVTKEHLMSIQIEKLAFLGRMAAGVAHEINNPLTGIVTFAHLLLKRTPPDSLERKDLDVIIEQADRCTNIIKGLLAFARSTPFEKTPTDINEVLRSSIRVLGNKADFHNITFATSMEELGPIMADPARIQQVFLNIMVNAADAMEGKGAVDIHTRKVFENGEAFVEVEFTDTGPGIEPANLTKIFEPFFTTKPVGKGTGLGLAVSHGIVREHGGNIRVESAPGAGASFFIRIPVEKPLG